MQRVIRAKAHPEIQIGPHCSNPYNCPLQNRCWSFLPEASVFTLYRGGTKGFALLKQGIQKLADIPADITLSDNQAIQRAVLLAGRPHIDRPALAAFLGQLEYPVNYLDFETIGTAIPCLMASAPTSRFLFNIPCISADAPTPSPSIARSWLKARRIRDRNSCANSAPTCRTPAPWWPTTPASKSAG